MVAFAFRASSKASTGKNRFQREESYLLPNNGRWQTVFSQCKALDDLGALLAMISELNRPLRSAVEDIHEFLRSKRALIVHFSGTPKGAGVERGFLFPNDLRNVLSGNAKGGIWCSVIVPGDRFELTPNANATETIGVVVDLESPSSLVAVARQRMGPAKRLGAAVTQSRKAFFGKPSQPFVSRSAADAGRACRLQGRPAVLKHTAHKQISTGRRGPGILMDVHPGFSLEVGRLAPTSISGLARVNNPHRNHN